MAVHAFQTSDSFKGGVQPVINCFLFYFQIMYMYYLLGYKPFGTKCEDSIVDEYVDGKKKNRRRFRPFASLLNKLDLRTFEKVCML